MKEHFGTLKKNLKAGKLVLFCGTLEEYVRSNPRGTPSNGGARPAGNPRLTIQKLTNSLVDRLLLPWL